MQEERRAMLERSQLNDGAGLMCKHEEKEQGYSHVHHWQRTPEDEYLHRGGRLEPTVCGA